MLANDQDHFLICATQGCENPIIDSQQKKQQHSVIYHHKTFIKFQNFKQKYHFLVDNEALLRYQDTLDRALAEKNVLMKNIEVFLERVIRESIYFDQGLEQIIKCWEQNDKENTAQYSKRIQEIWITGPRSQNNNNRRGRSTKTTYTRLLRWFEPIALILLLICSLYKVEIQSQEMRIRKWPKASQNLRNRLTYEFSPMYKHQDIALISTDHIRSDDYSDKLCLLTPSLDMKGVIQKFGFKWAKGFTYVYFGVCHFDTVKKKEFVWVWDYQIGGGTYMISNKGYTVSDWNEQINNKKLSFEFSVNTAIYIYFDGQKERITFMNSQTKETFQMQIKYNGEEMYPCVTSSGRDQEVQVIQPIEIPDL